MCRRQPTWSGTRRTSSSQRGSSQTRRSGVVARTTSHALSSASTRPRRGRGDRRCHDRAPSGAMYAMSIFMTLRRQTRQGPGIIRAPLRGAPRPGVARTGAAGRARSPCHRCVAAGGEARGKRLGKLFVRRANACTAASAVLQHVVVLESNFLSRDVCSGACD